MHSPCSELSRVWYGVKDSIAQYISYGKVRSKTLDSSDKLGGHDMLLDTDLDLLE